MAQAEVEIIVNDQQLDKLKGKLVELQKGLQIQYDIDGKPIDIVIDKSLNLQKQAKILTAELRKTKEGTAEFQLLSTRLGDVQDGLERTKLKSRDLFASLQLIPGPVGDFASKINGAIGVFKTLSSLSLKDIGFQIKEVGNDIADIGKNVFNLGKELLGLKVRDIKPGINEAKNALEGLNSQTSINTLAVNTNTAAENLNSDAVLLNKTASDENSQSTDNNTASVESNTKAELENQIAILDNTIAFRQQRIAKLEGIKATISDTDTTNTNRIAKKIQYEQNSLNELQERKTTLTTQLNSVATNVNTTSTNANTTSVVTNTISRRATIIALAQQSVFTRALVGAMTALKISEYAAATAAVALGAALKAIGIGILIQLVALLIDPIIELFKWLGKITGITKLFGLANDDASKSTKNAADNTKEYTKALDKNSEALSKNLQELDYRNRKKKLLAEIEGKSASDLLKITQDGLREEQKLYSQQIGELQVLRSKAAKDAKLSAEERANTLESIDKKIIEASNNYRKKAQDIEFEGLNFKKKIAEDTKSANDLLQEYQNDFNTTALINEREKQDKELQIQKEGEEKKIKALLISKELQNKLLQQVDAKYTQITLINSAKRLEEDLKNLKEYQRKIRDIEIAAIADEKTRKEADRQEKLRRELEDLENDKIFITKSEEEKERIRQLIRQRFANEKIKERKDEQKQEREDALKAIDDNLKFLQIRQEAIREGTKAFFDSQREILAESRLRELQELKNQLDNELITKENYEKNKTAIEDKYSKLRKDLKQQETAATLTAIGQTFDALAGLTAALASSYDEEAEKSEEAFKKRKSLQLATALMSAAGGIIQILAQPSTLPSPFDWIVKGINAAALGVTTAVQIANIKKTQFQGGGGASGTVRGMARGGLVEGPGTSTSDSVPTMLSNGEGVMTAGAVTMFEPLLSMMNQLGGGTPFRSNLNTTLPDRPIVESPSREPMIIKTYVVENELTTAQEKQARLKNLSTL